MRASTVAVLVFLAGCRDEQAGPRHQPQPMQAPQQAQAPSPPPQGRVNAAAPTDLNYRSGATWAGGAIQYLGAKIDPPKPRPGQTVNVTHYFTALKQPPQGWSFFAHLVDLSNGQMMNLDHEIQNGAMPLGSWPVGKVIEDTHTSPVPQGGKPRILLGFWQGDQRLPVDDPSAHDGNHRLLGPPLEAPEQPMPEYKTKKISKAPAIDGELNDAAWAQAEAVELVGSYDGRRPAVRTTAKLVYDAEHLYAAFECEDTDAWGSLFKKDDPIYTQEVVEVFIDPNGDGKTYNELQVSPNNVQFDAAFVERRSHLETAMAWESGMTSAVKVRGKVNDPSDQDQGWSVEMKIPIAKLYDVPNVPPKPGDRWRMNLYRLEHHGRNQIEGQAMSPLFVGDFHHLPRFGWLVFQ